MIPSTFAALVVTALVVLPGAAYIFAFESRAGAFRLSAPDRIVRFLVASAAFHALAAGLTYHIYKTQILSGRFREGEVSPWVVEFAAVVYLVVPYVLGLIAATPPIRQ